jgi:CRP/FNR family transcriptional regulator
MNLSFTPDKSCLNCSKRSVLFDVLTADELQLMDRNKTSVFYREGETIRKQGAVFTHVIAVNGGLAKVYLESQKSNNLLLSLLSPPSFIGGPGMFTDKKHHFTVVAITEVSVCFIDMKTFIKLLHSNDHFMEEYMKHLSTITLNIYNRLLNLTQKQMSGRLADALLYLSEEVYKARSFELSISSKDLAELSGMSKDNVVRNMKNFQELGYIQNSGKHLEIINPAKLISLSQNGQ